MTWLVLLLFGFQKYNYNLYHLELLVFFFFFQAFKDTQDEIWLEYTVSCFLQAIRFCIPNSRSHLARVLYLLSFDTPNEPVGRAFDKYLDQIPQWVWLSWIPQLLLSLQKTEAPHCKLVLLKISGSFPQVIVSVFWANVRVFLMPIIDIFCSILIFRHYITGFAHICSNVGMLLINLNTIEWQWRSKDCSKI